MEGPEEAKKSRKRRVRKGKCPVVPRGHPGSQSWFARVSLTRVMGFQQSRSLALQPDCSVNPDSVCQDCLCSCKIHMLTLNPQCDGIRRWELGRWIGHEGGALMNGITALIKETPESYPRELPLRATPGPLPCEVLAKRWPPMNEEVGLHQTPNLPAPRFLDSSASRTRRIKFLLFPWPPSPWSSVIAAGMD